MGGGVPNGAAGGPALPAAPAAPVAPVAPVGAAEIPQIVNLNWYADPIGGMYGTGVGARDWGSVPAWDTGNDDFSLGDWLMKGLEGVVDVAVPLLEYIIDD